MTKTISIEYLVNKPIDVVFENLSDIHKYAGFHPIITKVIQLSNDKFMVFETLRLGLLKISVKYPSLIEKNYSNKKIKMTAFLMKIIKIEIYFDLFASNKQTQVEETITFKSFFPFGFFLSPIFKKQHSLLFKNLENEI